MDAAALSCVPIILNPFAGGGRSRPLAAALARRLAACGVRAEVLVTRGRGDARRFARGLRADARAVLICGGDGTINEAIDGFPHRDIPIHVVPVGTENLLAKYLRIRAALEVVVDTVLRGGPTVTFDLGVVNGRRFATIVGVGFDGECVRRLELRRRGHIDHAAYFWPIWRTFWESRWPALRVDVDGVTVFEGPGMAFIGNTPRYALGLRVVRDARPDDGLLDVCAFRCASVATLLAHSWRTLFHRHVGRPDVCYARGGTIRASASVPVPVQVDGELAGTTPIEVSVAPAAVRFFVGPDWRSG